MTALERMRAVALDFCPSNGRHPTAVPRLVLVRANGPTLPMSTIYQPLLCLGLQGGKRVTLGGTSHDLESGKVLVASVDLPVTSIVHGASPSEPYVSMVLNLDPGVVSDLLLDMTDDGGDGESAEGLETTTVPALTVSDATEPLLDAFARLLDLSATPGDIPMLAPLIEREILYRVLGSVQGAALRRVALRDSHLDRIGRVISRIRRDYAETPRMEDLAQVAGMSASSFHRHFKAVTSMSPLAYLKQIRLQEARRLLVTGEGSAAKVAYRVGYESPSQFSREYARLFGAPPSRDAERIKAAGQVETAA